MKLSDINIRDPFVLFENGTYYLYGTRANNFGRSTAGFDVNLSTDLENWSDPVQCFDSEAYGLNREVNWAPEVHKYKGKYYMFATFTQENGLRGTYALIADRPEGPFRPHSNGALTPDGWECLDGTLYVSKDGRPYLVFCHEHTQILNGKICYVPLKDDLSAAAGEAVDLFTATDPFYMPEPVEGGTWRERIQKRYEQHMRPVVKMAREGLGGSVYTEAHHHRRRRPRHDLPCRRKTAAHLPYAEHFSL